jgi:hypothetical protein
MTPSVGETVAGRFEVRDRVGSGGFASVWRAHDTRTDRTVALKCGETGTHDAAAVRSAFEREVRTLGRFADSIAPSSLVGYVAGDADASPPYVALEYLPGATLADRLGAGDLGSSVRRRVVIDLVETIDALHRNGVVYLDIRPENVVVRDAGRPVLLDFNTAATTDDPVGIRFEADQFKPPELLPAVDGADGADPGTRSDVYAWGKLAFYLFTGAKVLPGDVPETGLDPLDFGGSCSRALADVIERATRPDPADRFADGGRAAAAVGRATHRERALLEQADTGVVCPVADGETMGRLDEETPAPWVVLPDEGGHVSPRHARLEHTTDGWVLEDTSQRGTYVGTAEGWTYLLSEAGHARRVERGEAEAGSPPPSRALLSPNVVVVPVHPEYGVELRLSTPD